MGQIALSERASDPDTPSAGYLSVYPLAATSGALFTKDDAGTVRTIPMEELANVFTAIQKIDISSTAAFLVEDDGVNDNTLIVDTLNQRVGVGVAPLRLFHIASALPAFLFEETDQAAGEKVWQFQAQGASFKLVCSNDDISSSTVWLQADRTAQTVSLVTITARTKIDQSDAAGNLPVLDLDQADLSEQFINFVCASTGAGDPVDTVTAVGTAYARLRISVNGVDKFLQVYNA